MRYLMVDRIEELKKLDYAVGIKCISLSDDAFEHHFPGQPIYPGALLLESMAQLGGALLEISLRSEPQTLPRCILSSAKTQFRGAVRPGDQLRLRAQAVSVHEESAKVTVEVTCDAVRVANSELLYVFKRIDDEDLERARKRYLADLTRDTRFVD